MKIQMESTQMTTPFGTLLVAAKWKSTEERGPEMVELIRRLPKPHLPPKMTVEFISAVTLKIKQFGPIKDFVFECKWQDRVSPGSPESGEHLDAQSWKKHNLITLIGTEDFESLNRRLPSIFQSESPYPIEYLENGFRIKAKSIPGNTEVSFHYVIASNPNPEPEECSCWVAVDIPHEKIMNSEIDPLK